MTLLTAKTKKKVLAKRQNPSSARGSVVCPGNSVDPDRSLQPSTAEPGSSDGRGPGAVRRGDVPCITVRRPGQQAPAADWSPSWLLGVCCPASPRPPIARVSSLDRKQPRRSQHSTSTGCFFFWHTAQWTTAHSTAIGWPPLARGGARLQLHQHLSRQRRGCLSIVDIPRHRCAKQALASIADPWAIGPVKQPCTPSFLLSFDGPPRPRPCLSPASSFPDQSPTVLVSR